MSNKIYILSATRGSYSDRDDQTCAVFSTEKAAEEALEKIKATNKIINEHQSALRVIYDQTVVTRLPTYRRAKPPNYDRMKEKLDQEHVDYINKRNDYVNAIGVDVSEDIKDLLASKDYPSVYQSDDEEWEYSIDERQLDEDIMGWIKHIN